MNFVRCKSNHPNIVQVFDYGQLIADGIFYFFDMELCEISLENYIQGGTINGLIDLRRKDVWSSKKYRNQKF